MYAMITFAGCTYPTGAAPAEFNLASHYFEDILMKVLPMIAGVFLASTITFSATAAPSQSEVMTLCKNEIKESFDDITRIRTSRFKERASGTTVTYKVSLEGTDAQKVTCSFNDGVASLTDSSGGMIASKANTGNTDS